MHFFWSSASRLYKSYSCSEANSKDHQNLQNENFDKKIKTMVLGIVTGKKRSHTGKEMAHSFAKD